MKNCPVIGCQTPILHRYLVCRWHWQRIPADARERLSYLHRRERTSRANQEANQSAIEYLNERQSEHTIDQYRARQLQGATA